MPSTPKVSIILPVYNGAAHLAATLDSLLAQEFGDFELCVVDDASTDATPDIVASYVAADRRVTGLRNAENAGVSESANRAIAATSAPLIARSDHDDLSRPGRLGAQVDAFDASPELGLLGGAIGVIDDHGVAGAVHHPPCRHTTIRLALQFNSAFYHSTVMMRRAALDGGRFRYRSEFPCTDDYDLWSRLAPTTRTANLPDVLVDYRVHEAQVSSRRSDDQLEESSRIALAAVEATFAAAGRPTPPRAELSALRRLYEFGIDDGVLDPAGAVRLLDEVAAALGAAPDIEAAALEGAVVDARTRLLTRLPTAGLARLGAVRSPVPRTELAAEVRRRVAARLPGRRQSAG